MIQSSTRIHISISPEVHKRLKRICDFTGWTHSGAIRLALALLFPVVEKGRACCKDGCIGQQVLDVLHAQAIMRADLSGRSTAGIPKRGGKAVPVRQYTAKVIRKARRAKKPRA